MPQSSEDILIQIKTMLDDSGLKEANKALKDVARSSKTVENAFKGVSLRGLDLVFIGKQLSRSFGRIFRDSTSAFKDIMEKSGDANTALHQLSAGATFLSFTIGSAINDVLEPFLPSILAIVEAIADFLQQHPEAVLVVIIGYLAGIGLKIVGIIEKLWDLIANLGTTRVATEALSTSFKSLESLSFKGLLGAVGVGGTILVGLAAIAMELAIVINGFEKIAQAGKEQEERRAAQNAMRDFGAKQGLEEKFPTMAETNIEGLSGRTQELIPNFQKLADTVNESTLPAFEQFLKQGVDPTREKIDNISAKIIPVNMTGFDQMATLLKSNVQPSFIGVSDSANTTTNKLNDQIVTVNNLTTAYQNLARAQSSVGGGNIGGAILGGIIKTFPGGGLITAATPLMNRTGAR